MNGTTATGVHRPTVPTLAQIQQRAAELLALQRQSGQHAQPPAPNANATPPPASPRVPETLRTSHPAEDTNPRLHQAAFHGIAGLAVQTIAPHTEAHPASLLLQLLAVFGNLVGRGPHCMVDATRHGLNLFVVLVGDSGKARKGTSWNQIARLFSLVDQPWLSTRVTTARLTSNGLVQAMQDQQPPTDGRLLALSEEFASVLQTLKRGNQQLSPLLRCAWDNGHLSAADLQQQLHATETHFSLIAHITRHELARNLPPGEAQNGFANRCLWACVQRNNCLPDGGNLSAEDLALIANELRLALDWATAAPEILFRRDDTARDLWRHRYPELSQFRVGLHGAATSRAEAQVLRLSAIYAALDSTSVIGLPHLQAALAVWDYCYASASILFGMSTGDPVADRIRGAIEASDHGLSKQQIRRLFHGHVEADRIDTALETLVALGALSIQTQPTGGRPSTLWSLLGEKDENPEDFLSEIEGLLQHE